MNGHMIRLLSRFAMRYGARFLGAKGGTRGKQAARAMQTFGRFSRLLRRG